jgi:hypothetical protein
MLLLDTGRIRIEYGTFDARLYVYRDGRYMGNELLLECVSHMLDEDPVEEYRKEELGIRNSFRIN